MECNETIHEQENHNAKSQDYANRGFQKYRDKT